MGCGASKVDDLPLVIRCRARKEMIKSAMNCRYDLSSAHVAYFHSLKEIGYALSRFVDEDVVNPSSYASSPVLTLPSDEGKTSSSISHIHSIEGNEDSHLHISSDSELDLHSSSSGHIHIHNSDNDDDIDSAPGNKSVPPLSSFYPPYNYNQTNWDEHFVTNDHGVDWVPPPYQPPEGPAFESARGAYGGIFDSYSGYRGNTQFYYMKKSAPASRTVIHEETRAFQEPGPSDYNSRESEGFGGFRMSGSSRPEEPKQHNHVEAPSPPPPPPPNVSGWDFLNFFDGYENGYRSYGYGYGSLPSSPDTSELREREGIPDLEEETENESHSEEVNMGKKMDTMRNAGEGTRSFVPKENNKTSLPRRPSPSSGDSPKRVSPGVSESRGSPKRVSPGNSEGGDSSKRVSPGKSEESGKAGHNEGASSSIPSRFDEETSSRNFKSDSVTSDTVSESVHEKNGSKKEVSFDVDEGSMHEVESPRSSTLTTLSVHGSRDLYEVFNEIKDEFDIAFSYGKEVAGILETGKVPYRPKFAILKVALSRIVYLVAPSFSSPFHAKSSETSRSQIKKLARSYHLDAVTDESVSLSLTLEKLYAWEKKLYKEVKDEERLRLIYDNMCKRLKDLDARGAESTKIDAAQASVRRLLTKLEVCIKAIDSISIKIQKVRDEELQPQLTELLHRFVKMWKLIMKCHRKQFHAIMASKTMTLKANTRSQNDSSMNATLKLKTTLLTWCKHFEDWINAQKSYVNSLNGWLHHCIDHEPVVTIDGNIPFSPGRMGAPPVFIICNDWHTGINRVSKDRVSSVINIFDSILKEFLERQDDEKHQRLKTEQLAKEFSEKRQHLRGMELETGKDALSETMSGSIVASESGVSPPNDVKVELRLLRKKTNEARARHKEAVKLVHAAASSTLQGGMIPFFKALESFTNDALKAHEQVRLQNHAQ